MPYTLERMKGRMPYFGSAAVEAHSVPNRKRNRPIFRMAGTPEAIMYTEMSSHAAHRQDAAEEEEEVHHGLQPLGGGAGQLDLFQKRSVLFHTQIHSFTGTAPAVRMRSAASALVAKSKKACACSDRVTDLLVTKTKGRWTS